MFQQFIAIIRGPYYIRCYSSNICVVDVYGLQFVQCGQLSRECINKLYYYFDAFFGYFITILQNARSNYQNSQMYFKRVF
jgi:hypothetical protein